MPTLLRFDLAGVLRLAEHAMAAAGRQPSFTEAEDGTPCPGALVWCNDHGVYLMSGGRPGLYIDPDDHDRGHVVVHAEGHRPGQAGYEPDLGGDDLAEHIHLDGDGEDPALIVRLRDAAACGARWLVLKVDPDTYSVGVA